MNSYRERKLQRRLWENSAKRVRMSIENELRTILPAYQPRFGGHDETFDLGERYWSCVNRQPEKKVKGFSDCKKYLTISAWPEDTDVIYFHNQTNKSGVLLIPLGKLLAKAEELRKKFGPDLLFMASNERFGFCFEEDEYDSYLRLWGIT